MKLKLSDVFDLQMGKTPARDNPIFWYGDNTWVSIGDIKPGQKYVSSSSEYITDEAVAKSGIRIVPTGTVIMSFKLSIGKVAITSCDLYTNEAIMAFINKGIYDVDPDYLYYLFLATDWSEGSNKAVKGITLNKKVLSSKMISLPPIDEQQVVAGTMNQIMQLITVLSKAQQRLDEIVKSRFVEMFGDPTENSTDWTMDFLSNHLKIIGGYAFKSENFADAGIPVLRIGNINSGVFKPVNMVFWAEDKKLERYMIYPGDLVVSLTGTVGKDDYGNVCILGDDYDRYYLNQRNAKLELGDTLNKYYLSELLKFQAVKRKLTGISRGVRQANIANCDIENLFVPIPSIQVQQQFAAFVEEVDKSKLAVNRCLKKAEYLKEALMQQYFG